MGKRLLSVSTDFLVQLLTAPGEVERRFTVEYPLPIDARVTENAVVVLQVESREWPDDEGSQGWPAPLERLPLVRVHFGASDATAKTP